MNKATYQLKEYTGNSQFAQDLLSKISSEGFAVLPGVLTPGEVDVEYSRMWSWVEKVSPGVSRHRPQSWQRRQGFDPWPCSQRDMMQLHQAGWVFNDLREVMAERVFEKLYGTRELHCSKDGFTLQRPTQWELELSPNDHFDQGSDLYGLQCIQGSIALTDQEHDDGCFLCWPGSHRYHQEITSGRKKRGREDFVILNDEEKAFLVTKGIQPLRVPVRKGDVILWRSDLVHKGAPPIGKRDNFRAVVYICMLPAALTPDGVYSDKLRAYQQLETGSHWPTKEEWFKPRREVKICVKPFFKAPPVLTHRQRLLYGLDRYSQDSTVEKPIKCLVERGDESTCNDDAIAESSCSKQRVRRWGRKKEEASAASTTSASPGTSDSDDEGFWNLRSDEMTASSKTCRPEELSAYRKACTEPELLGVDTSDSKSSKNEEEKEIRKLRKALREIGQLELQQQIMGNSGVGKLRRNQLEKISKKQEYLDRLQQLCSSSNA